MLDYTKSKSKEKKIWELVEGDIFMTDDEVLFSFIRVKRGGKSMVAKQLEDGVNYSIKIGFNKVYDIVGKLKVTKQGTKDNSISIKAVKLNETVVIMTGRGNKIPQLYTLVEITKKAYSHTFKNPVTGLKEGFKGTDTWKVFRLKDIIK